MNKKRIEMIIMMMLAVECSRERQGAGTVPWYFVPFFFSRYLYVF